jgi:phosphomannomutase
MARIPWLWREFTFYNGVMAEQLAAFRLGDVRGSYPGDIDEAFAVSFAHAFVHHFNIKGTMATGRDMRDSSISLQNAINEGLKQSGIVVRDLGLCTTELGYYASSRPEVSAVIIVTASHNPAQYNGFKCVLTRGEAVTYESGLRDVMELMLSGHRNSAIPGVVEPLDLHPDYVRFLESRFDIDSLQSGHIALNGLNGTAATLAESLAKAFSLPVTWYRRTPGPIPKEGADPANPRLAAQMKSFMSSGGYSAGVAWDGDCDRCVFFEADGTLIPTYYVVGLLAECFLKEKPGAAIVFDTKLCWNTLDVIEQYHGIPVKSETGHAFMKRHMRESGAAYGGELSSHHYFGEFFGCDSGMFAWLKMIEIVNRSGLGIGELVAQRREQVCCTPEINLTLEDASQAFSQVLKRYEKKARHIDYLDGLSFDMADDWRFTLRLSKTEPLVRLNFESRGNGEMLLSGAADVLDVLAPYQSSSTDSHAGLYIQ